MREPPDEVTPDTTPDPGPDEAASASRVAELSALGRALTEQVRRSFLGRAVLRFVAVQGIDRCVVLSSQAFTALIPLLILTATLAPAGSEDRVSEVMIRRFGLEGAGAEAVRQLFEIPSGATGGVSVFSGLLLLASGTSFARRLQKMYLSVWELEKTGVRGGLYAAAGLLVLILEIVVLYAARSVVNHLPFSWAFTVPVSVLVGTLLWTSIPYVLLNRRVAWRRLLLSGVIAALGTTAYSFATTVYMPRLVNRYTEEFGLFGVTIALIGWLLAIAGVLVASAVIGKELDSTDAPWAHRLRETVERRTRRMPARPFAVPDDGRRE